MPSSEHESVVVGVASLAEGEAGFRQALIGQLTRIADALEAMQPRKADEPQRQVVVVHTPDGEVPLDEYAASRGKTAGEVLHRLLCRGCDVVPEDVKPECPENLYRANLLPMGCPRLRFRALGV